MLQYLLAIPPGGALGGQKEQSMRSDKRERKKEDIKVRKTQHQQHEYQQENNLQ
jgi:hypothetical protein